MAENGDSGRPAATLLVLSIVLGGMLLVAAPAASGSNQETSAEPTQTTFTFVGDFKFWPFEMVFEVFDSNGESVLLVHQDDNTEDHQLILTPGIYTVEARVEAGSLSVPIKTRAFDSQEYSHVTVKVRYVVQTEVISLAFIAYLGLSKIKRVFRPSTPPGTPTTLGKPTTKSMPAEIDPRPPIDDDESGGGGRKTHSLQIEWNGQVIKVGTCCKLEIFATTKLDDWKSNYWHTSNKYEVNQEGVETPKFIGDDTTTDAPDVKWSREEDVEALFWKQYKPRRGRNRGKWYPKETDYYKIGSNSSLVNASIYGPHASVFSRNVRFWKNPLEEIEKRNKRLSKKHPFNGHDTSTLSKVRHVITNEGNSSSGLRMSFTSKCGVKANYDIQGLALASNFVTLETRRKRMSWNYETKSWDSRDGLGREFEEDPNRHFGKAAAGVGGVSSVRINSPKSEIKDFLKATVEQADLDKGTRFELIKKDSEMTPFELILWTIGVFDPTPISDFVDLTLGNLGMPHVPGKGPSSIVGYSPPVPAGAWENPDMLDGLATDTNQRPEEMAFEMISEHDFTTTAIVEALFQNNVMCSMEGKQIAHAGRDSQYKIDVKVSFSSQEKGCKPDGCENEEVFLSLSPEPDESLLGRAIPELPKQPKPAPKKPRLFHEHDYGELKNTKYGTIRYGVGPDAEFPHPHSRYYKDNENVEDRVRKDIETPQRKRKYTGILECSSGKYSVYCQEAVNIGEPVKWELDASDWDPQLAFNQHQRKYDGGKRSKEEQYHD